MSLDPDELWCGGQRAMLQELKDSQNEGIIRTLSKNTFSLLAGAIFLIVAIAHASRLIFKWEVIVADWHVPMWVSAVAVVIAGYLAFEGFQRKSN
jgi:hypothetical protein